ncbi:AsmA family protein, partial [Pseudomonas aeruginosa]
RRQATARLPLMANGRFSAEDITLGNPEWTAGKTSLERIEFRLAPLPLLWQTIRIPQIKLTQPRAELL